MTIILLLCAVFTLLNKKIITIIILFVKKNKISGSFIALSERFSHGVIWDKKRNVGDFFMQLSGRSWDIDLALV